MIKSNYERLLREEKDRELAQKIQTNDQPNLINEEPKPTPNENTKSAPTQNHAVTRQEMQNCVAAALNDEQNLADIN